MTPTRLIQVGTGGFGEQWCRTFLPPFVRSGQIDVVAAVDIDSHSHVNAIDGLGVPSSSCYTRLEEAVANHPADALAVVVPPAIHESIVDVGLRHGMDILSEKPIADTLAASKRIVNKVKDAGVKMGVTMSHRFDWDKSSLRAELRSQRNGPIDYIVARFTANARLYGSWRPFRHEMEHPMLIEGSVHHLDMLADLAGAPASTIWATTWRPPWAEYKGDTNVLLLMEFENGVRAQYEGATANAVGLNVWGSEYIRVECELATVIMDRRTLRRYPFDPSSSIRDNVDLNGGEVVGLSRKGLWTHHRLIDDFLKWRAGGPEMATEVSRNLLAVTYVQAAIDSSKTGRIVRVSDYIGETAR